jgi:flagellin
MSLVVNTNMASLITQNYLSTSQTQLQSADTQLASGLRINSAADDAAGYSISQRMTTQINGDNTAVQNTNNAVSLAQTAEGSLAQITANLQSVSQLAVEAANATNSNSDRQSLNNEAQQLLQEVDRVASTASFNGINLLDGSFSGQQFQVGANAGDTITMGAISSARIGSIGTATTYTATSTTTMTAIAAGGGGAAGGLTINGVNIGASGSATAASVATAINGAQTVATGAYAAQANGSLNTGDLVINGTDVVGSFTSTAGLASLINSQVSGVTASISGGDLQLTSSDGNTITATVTTNGSAVTGLNASAADTGAAGTVTQSANQVAIVSNSNAAFSVVAGTGGAGGFAAGTASAASATTGEALSGLDLSTVTGATAALTAIQNALNTVNSTNATLGAYQNRFASAVQTLQTDSQNLTQARSTIEDANFASATAEETRASVLQQAGVAVLGQANSQPQQILSLLQHL